jgi:hypothetical protein
MRGMNPTLLAVVALAFTAAALAQEPAGQKPTYLESASDRVPNMEAIGRRIWTPGLEENWVPQGLTVAEDHVLVSSYRPTPDLKANTGPCRVFRIDPATGKTLGHFDMGEGVCTHAGGLAYVGDGKLFLADTRQLFLIDMEKAFASGSAAGHMKAVKITGELRGSFAASDGKQMWIGTWTKEQPKSRMFRLDPRLFDDYDGQTVDHARAVESIPIPLEAQGAAFDRNGDVWISSSSGKFGKLYRVDRRGEVKAQYEMTVGLEDLGVDRAGRLWAVSESGTRKYMHWDTRFPFVFEIDTAKLK